MITYICMEYNLPRKYLSYSAMALWLKDKDGFRRRYYLNEKSIETAETIFGKQVHKLFEEDMSIEGSETSIEVEFEGLKLMGYIDSLDEDLKIIDFKTGHLSKDGKVPWDNIKVRKHLQFPFYCLMVQLKHGKYNPNIELHWHETRFKNKTVEFDGHILEAEGRELELTGRVEVFKRKVFKWEIEKLKKDIIKTAKEISNDYITWQKLQMK